jgi:ParB family chromosome partitioning protein
MAFALAEKKTPLIPIADIDVTEWDLRGEELGDIEGLMASIKANGLFNPISVRPGADGHYELIAGRRRMEAVRRLGAPRIPATVEPILKGQGANQALVLGMLIENFQREDLTPRQKAKAFAAAAAQGMSQKKIADAVGTTQPTVSKLIAILDLPGEVLDALDAGGIMQHQAEELLRLKDNPEALLKVFNARDGVGTIAYKVDRAIQAIANKANKTEERQQSDDELKAAKDEAGLRRALVKAVRQADEARAGAVQKASKARVRRELMLDFTIMQFIQMSNFNGNVYFAAACEVLGIPKVEREQGFGEVYDVEGWLKTNASENPLRLLHTIALVRGHMPLVGARDQLPEGEGAFAERTLEQLQAAVGYDVSLAERSLITGEEFKRVEVPKAEKKTEKGKAQERAAKGPTTSKLPGAKAADRPAVERDTEAELPEGKGICQVCEGMATVIHEGVAIACPNPLCEQGWVPREGGDEEPATEE